MEFAHFCNLFSELKCRNYFIIFGTPLDNVKRTILTIIIIIRFSIYLYVMYLSILILRLNDFGNLFLTDHPENTSTFSFPFKLFNIYSGTWYFCTIDQHNTHLWCSLRIHWNFSQCMDRSLLISAACLLLIIRLWLVRRRGVVGRQMHERK